VERSKRNCGRISVFKGHEARLNKAIFHILALKGPLTIYDMHKEVKAQKGLRETRYASINKRIRSLEELTFIDKVGIKKTKAGFRAYIYELTARAYLAMLLNLINLDDLLMKVDEATASTILVAVIHNLQQTGYV
jgi:predicted transcriptional regulator